MDTRPSDPAELEAAIRIARRSIAPRGDAPVAQPASSTDVPSAPPGTGPVSRPDVSDPRAVRIVAKTIYRELRHSGLEVEQVMAVASELLGLVTDEVRARRDDTQKP